MVLLDRYHLNKAITTVTSRQREKNSKLYLALASGDLLKRMYEKQYTTKKLTRPSLIVLFCMFQVYGIIN